ncbi:MAG: TIGR01841 family phasin [Gammaproteobacteria bacterium]
MVEKSKAPPPEVSRPTMPQDELVEAEADLYARELMGQVAKAFGKPPFSGVDVAALVETIVKNMAALGAANKHILENAQAVMVRHGEILRQTLEEASAGVDALANASNPHQLAARQAELLRYVLLRTLKEMRREAESTVKSSSEAFAEAFATLNSRVIKNVQEINELITRLER